MMSPREPVVSVLAPREAAHRIPTSDRFSWQPTLYLGPPRSTQHERHECRSHRRFAATQLAATAHPTGWPGGIPTGR